MTHRLLGIGATIAVVALGAAFVTAQGQGQAPPPQGQNPPAQGQVVPGRPGQAPGQIQGQGMGPGQPMNPPPGQPQGRGGRGRGGVGPQAPAGPGSPVGELAGLDLTADQRGTIEQLQRGARDQGAPFSDELQFTQKTLHRELFADKRDAARIASLQTKISGLEKQLADLRIKTAMAVADVLTAEQRETMRLRDGNIPGGGRGRPGLARR